MSNKHIYNPIEFLGTVELFTIAMIASFASWKLLNSFYEDVYEPMIDIVLDDDQCQKYVVQTSQFEIRAGVLLKEIFKWIIIIIILMIAHNIYVYQTK